MVGMKKRARVKGLGVGGQINSRYLEELYEAQDGKCYYTGIPMKVDCPIKSPSPDRVNSNKGYTVDNLVLCCRAINFAKNDSSEKGFMYFLLEIKLNDAVL